MARKRQTIRVSEILESANLALSLETIPQNEKRGVCMMLDGILHATGNYHGFRYLDGWPAAEGKTEYSRHYYG